MDLYKKLLKITFVKSKETKWIVCITAFVVTIISMLMTCAKSIERSYSEALHETAQYNFTMDVKDDIELQEYSQLDYWNGTVSNIAWSTSVFDMDIEGSPFYFSTVGLSGEYAMIYKLHLLEGEFPSDEYEIVVDSKFINNSEEAYKIGDTIIFRVFSPEKREFYNIEYTISGIFETEQGLGGEVYAFCTIDGAKRAFNLITDDLCYKMFFKTKNDTYEAIAEAYGYIDEDKKEFAAINEAREEIVVEEDGDMKGFVYIFRVLSIFIGLVSATLLYNMLQISVGNKIKQSGMIRSIGLRRRQLANMYILNLLLFIAISTVMGFVMTVILENTLGEFLFNRFLDGFAVSEYVEFSFKFSWSAFFVSIIIVSIIFTIVYIGIVRKAMKLTPLESIRYQGENESKVKVKNINYNKLKVVSFMSERNLARNKGRTINTSFSFFVSAVLILTVFMVVFSANLFEIDKLDKSNNYDYEFYNDSLECNVPYEILDKILGLDSVEKIAWGRRGFDEFWESRDEVGTPRSESSKGVEIRVYSDAVLERLCAGNSIDYTKWKDKPYCLLVNDSASDSNSLLLYDAQGKEKIVELNGNISDDFYCDYYAAGICIVMNENAAKQLYSEGYDYNVLFIKSAKKTACIEDVNALLGTYGITMIYNDLGVNSEDARAQLTSIICIIIYLLFCVCIMTATNLICNINVNVLLRKREYGILIALGMTRKDIVKLLIGEIAIIAEQMMLLAVPIALFISVFFIIGLEQEIKIIKLVCIAGIGSVLLYALTYFMCYIKGNRVFDNNVLKLMKND